LTTREKTKRKKRGGEKGGGGGRSPRWGGKKEELAKRETKPLGKGKGKLSAYGKEKESSFIF